MTPEKRIAIDNYDVVANRGEVHKFLESDGTYKGKKCLVVSCNRRASERIVSILILSSRASKVNAVDVPVDDKVMYANCGLVTYCPRTSIGELIAVAPHEVMDVIDSCIIDELGLGNSTNYKKMYEDLIATLTKNVG